MQPDPQDVVAWIQINYYASGEMSIGGTIGDKRLALGMLDHARDAINNQIRPEDELVIPNKDVEIVQHPNYPTLPAGDLCRRN